jgi:DUF1680 family protein
MSINLFKEYTMRINILLTGLLCIIVMSCAKYIQSIESIDLPVEWKFQPGDSTEYSKPDFDDKSWKTIRTGNSWETQGYSNYRGVAWYRTSLIIPSTLKSINSQLKSVRISLGKIADSDETFFNGEKIGGTNSRDAERIYIIPFNDINWDKENIIAIKVNNRRGNGGMYAGNQLISKAILTDIVSLSSTDKPSEFPSSGPSRFDKSLIFNFKAPTERLRGTMKVKVYEQKSKVVVFEKEDNITIGSNADTSYSVKVNVREPGSYRIDYYFFTKFLADTSKLSTLLSYSKTQRNNEKLQHPVVKLTIPGKSNPFELENINFDGYLSDRVNANLVQRLLNIDETGILECYYYRPGKQTWIGEYVGKYLHAASRAWRFSKNEQLKAQMDRIVDILIACQNDDGYLGTYLPATWKNWDVWAHKYNLLGLLSYYSATGYKPALESSVKMGDLLCRTFGEAKGQLNIIESSGHVGMASTSVLEPMTELYRFTGDKKYLDFCLYILKAYEYENGPKIISTLNSTGKVNKVANKKAYEMMSNLTGIVKLYQLTGDGSLLEAVEKAWKDIATNRLYITGTASVGELFQEDFVFPAGNDVHMGEGCVTTTWLQFSQAMYNLTGEPKYIDEIEKTIYNHLLAAENPQTGCVSYYTALQGKKPFRCTINAHCCLASIPRAIAAIPELAYVKNGDNGFSINIYSAGKIVDNILTKEGKEVPVECTIESKFPEEGFVNITMNPGVKADFRLALRVPVWCRNFKVNVNGKTLNGIPGKYLDIDQTWNVKSTILISFDIPVQVLDGGKSYQGYIAIKTGPQLLAVDQSLNPEIKDLDKIALGSSKLVLLTKTLLPKSWIGSQVYSMKAYYDGKPVDLKLVPFADAGQTDGDLRVWLKKN